MAKLLSQSFEQEKARHLPLHRDERRQVQVPRQAPDLDVKQGSPRKLRRADEGRTQAEALWQKYHPPFIFLCFFCLMLRQLAWRMKELYQNLQI